MPDLKDNILVWLPSPMGDAILCIPALRAIRKHFGMADITFCANVVVREVLSPCDFTNHWLEQNGDCLITTAQKIRKRKFSQVILFKNSFCSALISYLAGVPARIGYEREGRGFLLTKRLRPPVLPTGEYKPVSMVDYYLSVVSQLGADISDRSIQLTYEPENIENVRIKLPQIFNHRGPLVILVPGAAGGASKRWPASRFAELAEWLIENYEAAVVLSVAPNSDEKKVAAQIVETVPHKLVNLGDTPVTPGELKAIYSAADLVICNDTGPRHIAIGLRRKVITLVGPNNPQWTDPGYNDEIFIKGNAPCAPCDKPVCRQTSHFCMESITVEKVCQAVANILGKKSGEI